MPETEITLPGYYVRQIVEQVATMGADVDSWLKASGLDRHVLDESTLHLDFTLFRQLVLHALQLTQEPALGLLVGSGLLVNTHGILGYAAMNSGSIRQVIELFERFISLRTTLVSITHDTQGASLRVLFKEPLPLGDIRRPILEAVVLAIKHVLDFITLGTCQVQKVAFSFAADDTRLARDLFRCDVAYAQTWTGFMLPLDVLDQPLKMADPATFQDAALICQRELDKRHHQEFLSSRLRQWLIEQQSSFPSLQVAARWFHLSPRTLHRRLSEEGTSFHKVLDDVRHTLAIEHLKSGRLAIQEIAYTLGYTDMANFRRAFKRWESMPPSEFQTRHHHVMPALHGL
ncbi:MAG: helix-turn-helix domain-containing protein [Pseudomonadales bacterium]|nr:helix-turn-helix domain-containing protein [Pseudomonadales bacterium]